MILSAGLTPAWQQVLRFDSLLLGEVNRAREAHWCASGKVLNAARALFHLGASGKALTLVGGMPGEAIRQDFSQLGIPARWVESNTPTRICTTILDVAQATATELVPNAAELGEDERSTFLSVYTEEAAGAAVVILIGSLPAGTPADLYRELLARTPGQAILDARGAALLEALPARPFLVKPNRSELEQTLGRSLPTDCALIDAMREINERGAEWVVVTDGKKPVLARSRERLYRVLPLRRTVVNPIGCGDCMAAGIAWAIQAGRGPAEALAIGMATAASKVGQFLPGCVDREEVESLARTVEVSRV
jgi:1-phosphofructokinase family hexose kinase